MILIGLEAQYQSRHGGPVDALSKARQKLKSSEIEILKASDIWVTGDPKQSSLDELAVSQVLCVKTQLYAVPLLPLLKDIEIDMGKLSTRPNAPYSCELLLLSYKEEVTKNAFMSLPYPQLHTLAQFLNPISHIAKDWVHPFMEETSEELLDRLSKQTPCLPYEDVLKIQKKKVAV